MSKSALILRLLSDGDLSRDQIAVRVQCSKAYIRAVIQRDKFGGLSLSDRRYLSKKYGVRNDVNRKNGARAL